MMQHGVFTRALDWPSPLPTPFFKIAIGVVLLVSGLFHPPRKMCGFFIESKEDVARDAVLEYTFEAYPVWASTRPNRHCPDSLHEMNAYMNSTDIRDPWGHDYEMLCGASLPAGAKHVAVRSAGEDGVFGTFDDIESWDLEREHFAGVHQAVWIERGLDPALQIERSGR
jgi:hypothetical protein